jgi:predicted dehydrogenase
MSSQRLNSAVVGLGIGAQHALGILENPQCYLSKIVDFDEEKINSFISTHNLSDVQKSSFDDAIDDKRIDFLSIASFDDCHYKQVISSLNANKHVFVEKPLCQTREQLTNIHKIFLMKECAISSNLLLRTAPLYQYIKEIISDNKLGEIYAFDGDYLYGRVHKITDGWRKDVQNYSVMEGGGIHIIDLMLWLTSQKPLTVTAQTNKIATKNSTFRYHDFHSATFSFESGLIGRITANFGCMHRHQHVVRIFGTKGTFIHDDMGARVHWSNAEDGQPEFIKKASKPNKKSELINEFVDLILKKNFKCLAQREFDLMSVVLAADEAIDKDKPLTIEYLKC